MILYKVYMNSSDNLKGKTKEYSQALGDFVNYNQYYLNELVASYEDCLKLKLWTKN